MRHFQRKGWQTNSEILCAFQFGRTVLHPFARMSNDRLTRRNIENPASVSDPQESFQN
jgi:hypothetical protein